MRRSGVRTPALSATLVLLASLGGRPGHGQALPAACYDGALRWVTIPLALTTPLGTLLDMESAVTEVAGSALVAPEQRDALLRLRNSNANAFDVVLARVTVNAMRHGSEIAGWAAARYEELSSGPTPMLVMLEREGDFARRGLALGAVRGVLSDTEQQVVFRYACDAGWQLAAFAADPGYAGSWLAAPGYSWPADAKQVVMEAARLLAGGRFEPEIRQLVAKSIPAGIEFQRD